MRCGLEDRHPPCMEACRRTQGCCEGMSSSKSVMPAREEPTTGLTQEAGGASLYPRAVHWPRLPALYCCSHGGEVVAHLTACKEGLRVPLPARRVRWPLWRRRGQGLSALRPRGGSSGPTAAQGLGPEPSCRES
ncbi:hypothetical protein Dimus_025016, partial [Dionaea muscipula]